MILIALDPGSKTTGIVRYDTDGRGRVLFSRSELKNEDVLMSFNRVPFPFTSGDVIACEWIEYYGAFINAGADVFDTCRWIGRFQEKACWLKTPFHLVTRRDVKLHLCGNMKAKDQHVRQALLDRFGGSKKAKGTKRSPGPLYGVSGHAWSALAVAITFAETMKEKTA